MGHTIRFSTIALLFISLFSAAQPIYAQTGIDLAVHYVEGTPIINEVAYDVDVYLSVVDNAGNPIKDLTEDSFTIAEDSQKIDITSIALADDEPINIVLVMDTSGSMSGTGINAAKAAASNFVSGLEDEDRVAIVTFDDDVKTRTDFTNDHRSTNDHIALIEAKRGAGTCLYDAAYEAIQMASTLPSGRRALVLFTDGVDETPNGKACSRFTIEDVIGLASSGGTRTPIYTLGMGILIESNTLQRLAELTGGHYLYSPDATQLETTFQLLSDQLRAQYVLKYKSVASPGPHTLAVNVNYQNVQDNDTRNFLLSALLPQMSFVTPLDGDRVSDQLEVEISLLGQGATVNRVEFRINGKLAGADDTAPYEAKLDLGEYSAGDLIISAVAYGADNSELASKSVTIFRVEPTDVPDVVDEPEPEIIAVKPDLIVMIGGGLAALGLLTILILVVVIILQRNQKQLSSEKRGQSQPPPQSHGPVVSNIEVDRTMDSFGGGSDAFGALTIEASDDPSMAGHRFEILTSLTTLGRSADNDINFPKDTPVSRRHVEIFERNGRLYLREVETVDSSGVSKPPKFGTFVNDVPIGTDPIALKTGDEIRLGKRVRIKFEAYEKVDDGESLTYDDEDDMTSSDDPDKTQDQF